MPRIVAVLVLLGVGFLALAGMWLTLMEEKPVGPPPERMPRSNIPLATLFYVGRGLTTAYEPKGELGTRGWNIIQNDSLYEGLVLSKPAIGWYASQNVETIAWQLEQMQRAGISVIFISWQGWGDDDLDGVVDDSVVVQYNKTTRMLLDYIKDNRLPFEFSFMVEDFPNNFYRPTLGDPDKVLLNLRPEQRQMVMDYLWDNYFSPETYGDIAFQWIDKPFLAGGANSPGQWWEIPGFSDPRFELYEIYDKPEDEADHLAAAIYTPPPSSVPGRDGIVITWPRHDGWPTFMAHFPHWLDQDKDELNVRMVDPYGNEGAYDRAWKEIIEYRTRSDIKLIFIYYWNSYSEITYLEPDSGIGPYAVGDMYIRKTAHYYDLFRKGLPFQEFVPDWVSLREFSPTIDDVPHQDLGLNGEFDKDALARCLLRQAQDWVTQYTGRTFSSTNQNVVGWVDQWTGEGDSSFMVAPYRSIGPGTVIQIGSGSGIEPAEFAQVEKVVSVEGREIWELDRPLKHIRTDGEVITRVSPDIEQEISGVPPSVKYATIQLAENMWRYIAQTAQGRVDCSNDLDVARIEDSVVADGIRRALDPWRR